VQPSTQTDDFRRSVARIAQFQPFGSGEVRVEFSRRAFILGAAYENAGQLDSLANCREVCSSLWGLELHIDEIRDVVKSLVTKGDLEQDGAAYRLTEKTREELSERVQDSGEAEAQAFADWELAVASIGSELSKQQMAELRKDLEKWLQEIVTKHGVEAALLLYPEHERSAQLLSSVESLGFDFLPSREECIEEIRPKALFAFIHRATSAQRIYLANLFTTAYMVAVFTLDPKASEAVQSLTQGQRVYLDTNIIYAVLNLSGPRAYLSARRVLELTRKLGYDVCVTPWTVAEMRHSVQLARDKLAKTTLPPRALAEIAAEASGDETFVTAYWRKFKDTGVKPDDFLDFHEQIEGLLGQADIKVENEGCTTVDRDEDGLAEQIGILESVPGGANKSGGVKEHDAKHRMLIERLRGQGHRRFSNAGYWFITRDSILIPYGAERKPTPDALPFASSLPAWAQIVRSLSPRTEDYEQTLVDLLDTPAVRPRGMVSYETVAEVLGRIDMLVEDSSEEVATRMLLDGAVMQQVESSSGSKRPDFIDTAVVEKKNDMEKQLQEMQARVAKERSARLSAEQRANKEEAARLQREQAAAAEAAAANESLTQAKTRADDAEARAKDASRREQDASRREQDATTKTRVEINALKEQVSDQDKIVRGLVAALLVLGGAVVTVVPIAAGWITDGLPLVGVILVGGAIMLAAVAWLFGRKKAAAIVGAIAIVLGIAAALYDIVSADDPGAPPSARATAPGSTPEKH
jgi:predicted nucleic acid-binding protein